MVAATPIASSTGGRLVRLRAWRRRRRADGLGGSTRVDATWFRLVAVVLGQHPAMTAATVASRLALVTPKKTLRGTRIVAGEEDSGPGVVVDSMHHRR
jgi:hypothetical protein